jgi:sugar phosphate isomerase/epimerase
LRIIAELEFSKVEVAIHEQGPHLKPSEVVADVTTFAQRLRLGPGLSPAAFSVVIEAPTEAEWHSQLRGLCRLARLSAVPLLTLPAAVAGTDHEAEIERLTTLCHIAGQEGILLNVSTQIGTLTEDPDVAVKLCESVSSLGLTLDPSHYVAGPLQGGSYDALFPHVRHVQLRDTGRGPNQFQVRVGQGEIEYGRIISHLCRYDYDRLLTVDIRDIPDAPFPMEPEVRKLKYLLESLV